MGSPFEKFIGLDGFFCGLSLLGRVAYLFKIPLDLVVRHHNSVELGDISLFGGVFGGAVPFCVKDPDVEACDAE